MAVEVIKITKTELERRKEAFSSMAMLVAGLNASNRALKQRETKRNFNSFLQEKWYGKRPFPKQASLVYLYNRARKCWWEGVLQQGDTVSLSRTLHERCFNRTETLPRKNSTAIHQNPTWKGSQSQSDTCPPFLAHLYNVKQRDSRESARGESSLTCQRLQRLVASGQGLLSEGAV